MDARRRAHSPRRWLCRSVRGAGALHPALGIAPHRRPAPRCCQGGGAGDRIPIRQVEWCGRAAPGGASSSWSQSATTSGGGAARHETAADSRLRGRPALQPRPIAVAM